MHMMNKIKRKASVVTAGILAAAMCTGLSACSLLPDSIGQARQEPAIPESVSTSEQSVPESAAQVRRPHIADADQKDKAESVYVKADPTGKAEDISVSVTLRNSGDGQPIRDMTNLQGIKNKAGDEEYTLSDDGELVWENHGEDITYEGTSRNLLPVDTSVTYFLDGEEISPSDLAGKSGEVKIRFDYSVQADAKVTVDNDVKNETVLFMAMTFMILPDEHFDSISVENGRAVSMDEQTVVIGYALPKLADSLNLSEHEMTEEIEIPEYVEVTAYATDFELDFTATVLTNGLFKEIEDEDLKDFDDTIDDMHELADASKDLVSGTKELADGADTFGDYLSQYTEGVGAACKGVSKLSEGTKTLNDNKSALAEGAGQLRDGLTKLDESLQDLDLDTDEMLSRTLAAVQAQLQEKVKSLIQQQMAQMQEGASEAASGSAYQAAMDTLTENEAFAALTDEEKAAIALQIAAGTQENFNSLMAQQEQTETEEGTEETQAEEEPVFDLDGLDTAELEAMNTSLAQLKESVHALAEGSSGLYDGIVKYNEGISGVHEGVGQLHEGLKKLDQAGSQMTDGYDSLKEGTRKLHEGFEEFDKEGIRELTKMADEDLKDLLTRIRTLKAADGSYDNFSGLAEGKTSEVRFIIETAEIKP